MTNGIADTSPLPAAGSERPSFDVQKLGRNALTTAAGFWFVVTLIGQWTFVFYILAAYGGPLLAGNLAGWNEVSTDVYVAGDLMGNLAVVMHILLAVIIIGGGPLQLVPQIRAKAPTFHRWNGRIYVVTAMISAIAGFYLISTRETPGGLPMHLGISLDAALILTFAVLAWRSALARNFRQHRRWALRLFMVVSAVWFFRVGLMGWLMVNNGPVGFDPKTFTGPFLNIWAFGQYLIPLALLEGYFYARERGGAASRLVMSVLLSGFTVFLGIGIFAATMGMWLPKI